jgi:DnaJ-class molecular chaperone
MAHAEKCPICYGTGQTPKPSSWVNVQQWQSQCHGCGGKGWVIVGEEDYVTTFYPLTPTQPMKGEK